MTKLSNRRSIGHTRTIGISVIVPCINEVQQLPALLRVLRNAGNRFTGTWELIIVDGGSTDGTEAFCEGEPDVRFMKSKPSRAIQMNLGTRSALGSIFYFVHADTRPPLDCLSEIWSAHQNGARLGGYSFELDSQMRLHAFTNYMTTFNVLTTRGGDQTIFFEKELFEQLGGFSESMQIMEEFDLLKRADKNGVQYCLLDGQTIVSARKYEGRTWLQVQLANAVAFAMWRAGVESETIKRRYAKLLGADISADES